MLSSLSLLSTQISIFSLTAYSHPGTCWSHFIHQFSPSPSSTCTNSRSPITPEQAPPSARPLQTALDFPIPHQHQDIHQLQGEEHQIHFQPQRLQYGARPPEFRLQLVVANISAHGGSKKLKGKHHQSSRRIPKKSSTGSYLSVACYLGSPSRAC